MGADEVRYADDLPPVVGSVLHHARRHLDVDVAYLAEFRGPDLVVRAVAGDGARFGVDLGTVEALADSLGIRVLTGVAPAVVGDVAANPTARRAAARSGLAVGAYAGVPIRLDGGAPYGMLNVASVAARDGLGPRDLAFLHVLAGILADELSRTSGLRGSDRATRSRIEAAIDEGDFEVVFQPIIDLATGATAGVEALARFDALLHRPPDLWFADAHRLGLGLRLEAAAVERALEALDVLAPSLYVGINASPGLVLSGLLEQLLPAGPAATRIVLEITEHLPVDNYPRLNSALAPLRVRGIRVAVDDVGAGFASLHHVLRLRPDVLKLDASLTRFVGADAQYDAAAEAVATLAARAGAGVVAEAVESTWALEALRARGLGYGQGYLFAAPAPAQDVRSSYPVTLGVALG